MKHIVLPTNTSDLNTIKRVLDYLYNNMYVDFNHEDFRNETNFNSGESHKINFLSYFSLIKKENSKIKFLLMAQFIYLYWDDEVIRNKLLTLSWLFATLPGDWNSGNTPEYPCHVISDLFEIIIDNKDKSEQIIEEKLKLYLLNEENLIKKNKKKVNEDELNNYDTQTKVKINKIVGYFKGVIKNLGIYNNKFDLNYLISIKNWIEDLKKSNYSISSLKKIIISIIQENIGDENNNRKENSHSKNSESNTNTIQKIYYGAPGTGKSYSVAQFIKEEKSKYENIDVIRTTIYQDYSYYDFIGSIQPKVENDKIKYEFAPGPFSVALKKASQDKNMQVYLIIEEMSRGNIASIFGDTFQLLDRKDGKSEYSIHNELIANYVHSKQDKGSKFQGGNLKVADNDSEMDYGPSKVFLPPNLHIIGTVNTSDQNVNVMDTAFKRRFSFEYVSVEPQKKDGKYLNDFTFTLRGQEFNWIKLYTTLNQFIVEKLGLSEDKQIGQFFIKFDNSLSGSDNKKQIGDKLLQYLWEDVQNAAISEVSLFKNDIKTFGQLYDYFNKKDKLVFSENLMELYNQNSTTLKDEVEENE